MPTTGTTASPASPAPPAASATVTTWVIATADNGIIGWHGWTPFNVVSGGVDSSSGPTDRKWIVALINNGGTSQSLVLRYIPEPGCLSLQLLGALAMLGKRNRPSSRGQQRRGNPKRASASESAP